MKRKVLAIALATTMTASCALPAFCEEAAPAEEANQEVTQATEEDAALTERLVSIYEQSLALFDPVEKIVNVMAPVYKKADKIVEEEAEKSLTEALEELGKEVESTVTEGVQAIGAEIDKAVAAMSDKERAALDAVVEGVQQVAEDVAAGEAAKDEIDQQTSQAVEATVNDVSAVVGEAIAESAEKYEKKLNKKLAKLQKALEKEAAESEAAAKEISEKLESYVQEASAEFEKTVTEYVEKTFASMSEEELAALENKVKEVAATIDGVVEEAEAAEAEAAEFEKAVESGDTEKVNEMLVANFKEMPVDLQIFTIETNLSLVEEVLDIDEIDLEDFDVDDLEYLIDYDYELEEKIASALVDVSYVDYLEAKTAFLTEYANQVAQAVEQVPWDNVLEELKAAE